MIVCCGEALIDMLPRRLADGGSAFLPVAGGAVFNTAITLGRLGTKAAFFSGLSNDLFGQQLRDALAASGVDDGLCIFSKQPTTLAFVKLSDGHAQYVFYDENSAGRLLSKSDLPSLPKETKALHFGAISLIPEPCGSAYEALALKEAANRVISLDPNIRPDFITDTEGHRARILRMIGAADIVKVSDEDLAWLAPDAAAETTIGEWLRSGPSIVVLTRGSEGATLYTSHGELAVPTFKVKVADTVGAGDSFNGGFLHGLDQAGLLSKQALRSATPQSLRSAAELAAKVAAVTVSRAGANPPWSHELEAHDLRPRKVD